MDRLTSQQLHDLPAAGRISFGQCVLDLGRGELLTAGGERASLRPKALELLCVLGAYAGEVVSKDELMHRVWPDVIVTDDSLTQIVAEIRRCVGDTRREWLRTVPRRGYTLVKTAMPPAMLPPSRLPALDATMHGRDDDLAQLAALLRPGTLVTILGAGGIGKTRLALELAHRAAELLDCPASWVDLAPASDDAQVLPLVAAALGIRASGAAACEQLVAALAARRGMLVLDNCEHRLDAVAALLQALRGGAPQMIWLATSQAPLLLQAEQIYRLDTLDVPPPGAALDAARGCGAIAMLEQRARAIDHRFALDSATLPTAIDICRGLDGVALALEMAAARIPALGVGGVHDLLSVRLDTLKNERRDVAPRQRSLLATLDWSCSLLSPVQRQALESLATFAGCFDLDSGREVIGADDALETLCALVELSLVSVDSTEPRQYRLLESMRLFALARLTGSGSAPAAYERHRRAMALKACQFDSDSARGRNDALLRHYLPQLSDMALAFDNACEHQDADVAGLLLDVLRILDGMRGVVSATSARIHAVLPLLPAASPKARTRIHLVIAACGWLSLPGLPAAAAAAQVVRDLRERGDESGPLQRALLLLAVEQARAGDVLQARATLDEVLALAGASDAPERRAVVQTGAGRVAAYAGDWALALVRMESACQLARMAGAPSVLDFAMSHLSGLARLSGDTAASRRHAARAIERARDRHTLHFLAFALLSAMEGALAEKDVPAARSMVPEVLECARDGGVLYATADVCAALAFGLGVVETGCRLAGWAQAHQPLADNAVDGNRAANLKALLREANASLGASAVQHLVGLGAALSARELFELAATLQASAEPTASG